MSDSKAVISSPCISDAEQLDRAEYQALETALLQTVRGRNFLTEYLRRNGGDAVSARTVLREEAQVEPGSGAIAGAPAGDTDKILQAVENLHQAVMSQQNHAAGDHIRMDILEMAEAIARTRDEIAAMRTDGDDDHLTVASEEMDAIVLSTEKATNDILQAAEKIQEVAWRLREAGADDASCEEIDNSATDIYMACSFQDITGQRTTRVVRVLQYLEERINSMIEIWGLAEQEKTKAAGPAIPAFGARAADASVDERPDAHLLNGPQMQEEALGQDNIDALLGEDPLTVPENGDEPVREVKEQSVVPLNPAMDEANDDQFDEVQKSDLIDEEQLKALFS